MTNSIKKGIDDEEDIDKSDESWSGIGKESDAELKLALEQLCDSQTPLNAVLLLQVLYNIHKRILDEPSVDKYYRVYVKGEVFQKHVWSLDGAQSYLQLTGWVQCGNYIVLSKSYPVKQSIRVIEESLRKKKRAQIAYTGSVHAPQKRPDIAVRRARSTVGESTITEDEIVDSFTNIETPNESDSAIGSGIDDEEEIDFKPSKQKLRRVESTEHVMGNEEYIVVDFVGQLEVSSRKTSRADDPPSFGSCSPESAINVSSPVSNISAFEEIYDSDSSKPEVNEKQPEDETEKKALEFDQMKDKQPKKVGRGLKEVRQGENNVERKKIEQPEKQELSTAPIKRSSSNRDVSRRSVTERPLLERTSSQRSVTGESEKPASLVMQNKLMFDNQIAHELKRKYPSTQSLETRRRTSNLDLSAFEKPKLGHASSFNEKHNRVTRKNSDDVDLSGIVAASRGMFENKPRSGSTRSIQSNNSHTEVYVKRTDSDVSESSNPFLKNYKNTTPISSSKKKKFPFRKGKTAKINESKDTESKNEKQKVELIKVETHDMLHDDAFEERAIDVPSESLKEEADEKKKKGLFSRMRRSRKSSSDSEQEHKNDHKQLIEKHIVSAQDKIDEKEEKRENDMIELKPQHDQNDDMSMELKLSVNADSSSLETKEQPQNAPQVSEAASVLESIIDRKPSFQELDKEKQVKMKKKFFKKKKKQPTVESTETSDLPLVSYGKVADATSPQPRLVVDRNSPGTGDIEPDIVSDTQTIHGKINDIDAEHNNAGSVQKENDNDVQTISTVDTNLHAETSMNEIRHEDEVKNIHELMDPMPIAPEQLATAVTLENCGQNVLLENEASVINQEKSAAVQHVENVESESTPAIHVNDMPEVLETDVTSQNGNNLPVDEDDVDGDDLVAMLAAEARTRGSSSLDLSYPDDSISYDENHDASQLNDSVTATEDEKTKKKKRRFRLPIKRSTKKDKEKKMSSGLNVSVPDGLNDDCSFTEATEKSSRKSKRPKSMEILPDMFHRKLKTSSQSSPTSMDVNKLDENGDVSFEPSNSEDRGKKKKLSLFKKKNKKSDGGSPVKTMTFTSYTDTYEQTNDVSHHDELKDDKLAMMSSDEFTIPENNAEVSKVQLRNGHSNQSTDESKVERRQSLGPDHKEFIKTEDVLSEIKSSESMEF